MNELPVDVHGLERGGNGLIPAPGGRQVNGEVVQGYGEVVQIGRGIALRQLATHPDHLLHDIRRLIALSDRIQARGEVDERADEIGVVSIGVLVGQAVDQS